MSPPAGEVGPTGRGAQRAGRSDGAGDLLAVGGAGGSRAQAKPPTPATRRGLLAGATVLAGSLLCGATPAAAQVKLSADALSIEAAVRLEQLLAVSYASLAGRPTLDRELRGLFGLLAEQEHQHAQALLALAEYLGGPPPGVPTLAQTERAITGLAGARTRPAALELAERLEQSELQSFYFDEQTLTDIKLMELTAAVMCSDAQHLVLVRQASGANPIPAAFETGQETG